MRLSVAQAKAAFPGVSIPKLKRKARGLRLVRQPRAKSKAEEQFAQLCVIEHLPPFEREHLFALELPRYWRFDFAWPAIKVAVEIEGLRKRFVDGVPYAIGRHCTFEGFAEDCRKYATANILGWHVIRFNQALVYDGTAIDLTRKLIIARELLAPRTLKLSELSLVGDTTHPVQEPRAMTPKQMAAWVR